MRKHFTITLWVMLFSFGWVHAQSRDYTDAEIGFEREHVLKELIEHKEYSAAEVDDILLEMREEYVKYHEQRLNYIREHGNRIAVPVPITSCANMDFSQNTNLWTFNASNNNYNTRPSQDLTNNSWGVQGNIFNPAINDPVTGTTRFQVMPASSFDANLNSAVNPNATLGTNVMLLGDAQEFVWPGISNRGQEEITKSFVLTTQNAVLRYGYAIVFERPTHAATPNSFDIFISVNGVDLAGCSAINFNFNTAQMGNGFVPSAIAPLDLVRPWATNTIDLLSQPGVQLGDVITVSFRNRDCGFGGHGSYAYVAADCLPSTQAIASTSASGNLCVDEEITFTANVDILVGAITQWQILQGSTVVATIAGGGSSIPFTFDTAGTYTINFTMTSPGGCTINSTTSIVVEECCVDCDEAGAAVYNGIFGVLGECGTYGVKIAPETLECYTLQLFKGDGSGWTTITASDLVNDVYEWNYTNNGSYTMAIRLLDPITGKTCFIKKKKILVNCCQDCNTTGVDIFESLTETGTCGEYKLAISNETLSCYSVEVYHDPSGWNTITSSDLVNDTYTYSYPGNGSFTLAVRLRDLVTGKVCYYNKKGVTVDCFPSVCMEDPVLEGVVADNLKNILNAILALDNGFTSVCASGSPNSVVDITTMPEVVQFMQVYDLQNRLQNAIDIREAQPFNSYPYYTADITDVYYRWGYSNNLGHPPCLRITFANQPYGVIGPVFSYVISGGYANGGVPLNPDGLNPTLIEEFTNITLNVDESKATIDYIGTDGQASGIYDILYGTTNVEGASNGLPFCWFHDLNYTPAPAPAPSPLVTQSENKLIIYPNPASSLFSIAFEDKEQIEDYQVFIRSIVGIVVYESRVKNEKEINVEQLPPGVYFVQVLTDDGQSYQKQLIVK